MKTLLEQLASEIASMQGGNISLGQKHTTPTGTPSTPYYTGPGGLFGVQGLERDLFSTRIIPIGLASSLPALGSNMMNPLFAYLTGFLAETGTIKDGVCDDPQIAGPGKSCLQTAQYGRYEFMTRELELNRLGQQIDRGEFQDLRLVNDPILTETGSIITPNVSGSLMLNREVLMRFIELGISFQNLLSRQLYIGNPANNSAGGGYKEFPGLDILINTGKVDALTGTTCPSLDSDIKDFNYAQVDASGGDTIVNTLVYLLRYLRHIADRTNLSPVTWSLVMRRELFWELTAVWPCSYLTYRCSFRATDGTIVQNVSATDQIAMRDAMRNGMYITIDGENYPVVLDDSIPEDTNTTNANVTSGCFASDIYVVPRTIRGGMSVLYWEYYNYSGSVMQGINDGNYGDDFWTDGGRFLWHKKPPVNWCVQWIAKTELRVILRTPQLAGRLLNVQYCPLQHTRDPFPDDPYHVNGGVSTARPGPSLYSDWNLPA